jgi:hypothetical protein
VRKPLTLAQRMRKRANDRQSQQKLRDSRRLAFAALEARVGDLQSEVERLTASADRAEMLAADNASLRTQIQRLEAQAASAAFLQPATVGAPNAPLEQSWPTVHAPAAYQAPLPPWPSASLQAAALAAPSAPLGQPVSTVHAPAAYQALVPQHLLRGQPLPVRFSAGMLVPSRPLDADGYLMPNVAAWPNFG